jgi:uncharacterized membrane protein YphA (DoxX/SURF4 family)
VDPVWYVSRIILAGVFILAAVAKVVNIDQWQEGVRALGLSKARTAALSAALPILELILGVCLFFSVTAKWAAIGSLIVLTIFTIEVVRVGRSQGRYDCKCFGRIWSSSSLHHVLLRNLCLFVLGLVSLATT